MSARRGPASVTAVVDSGTAQLVPDTDNPGGWTLLLDGTPQSYVDLTDPTALHFEYIRRMASVIDTAAPAGSPMRILHLGGGAMTLPRYVAATRPASVQRIVELDAALIALVRRTLPLPRLGNLRVRAADARAVVEAAPAGRHDVVVLDVFDDARVPGQFATVEFAAQAARVLRPGGRYVVNLADGPPLTYTKRQVATLCSVFGEVCLLTEPFVLRRRRFGNVVLVAAVRRGTLPVAELTRAALRDPSPARLMIGSDLDRFVGGARPVTDAEAHPSPAPPASLF
ncbi:MAG: fused MFS/spermidine synthase [Dactylosporangium sp.]|nr:fused MFS/spermidine synthase [Dactylosporangium sp.]NNJ60889.1 fused MFS/spermidine synthase [Dactylosporangium sp.]